MDPTNFMGINLTKYTQNEVKKFNKAFGEVMEEMNNFQYTEEHQKKVAKTADLSQKKKSAENLLNWVVITWLNYSRKMMI